MLLNRFKPTGATDVIRSKKPTQVTTSSGGDLVLLATTGEAKDADASCSIADITTLKFHPSEIRQTLVR